MEHYAERRKYMAITSIIPERHLQASVPNRQACRTTVFKTSLTIVLELLLIEYRFYHIKIGQLARRGYGLVSSGLPFEANVRLA